MFKIAPIPKGGYSEVSQTAPLRWVMMHEQDGTLTAQHTWWKCKDFLNDVVVFLRTGQQFGIYGFNNTAKINDAGGYLALKHVPPFFAKTLKLLNEYLGSKKLPKIMPVDTDKAQDVEWVLLVPSFYWTSTFAISLITSLIRACVYADESTFKKCVAHESTLEGYFDRTMALFVPENFTKIEQLIYLNYQYSFKKPPASSSTHIIHDAGLQSWTNSWKNA